MLSRPTLSMAGLMCLLVLLVLGYSASRAQTQEKAPAPGDSAKVKNLLKERLATLRQIAESIRLAYASGIIPYTHLYRSQQAVLHAELDLADSEDEWIAVLSKLVAAAKDHEEQAVRAHKAGTVGGSGALHARVARLEAEIALERAMTKAGRR